MFDVYTVDKTRDLPLVRTYEFEDNKIHATRTDPYGHWILSLNKGALPNRYRGAYTSFLEAEKAVQNYLNERGKKVIKTET